MLGWALAAVWDLGGEGTFIRNKLEGNKKLFDKWNLITFDKKRKAVLIVIVIITVIVIVTTIKIELKTVLEINTDVSSN